MSNLLEQFALNPEGLTLDKIDLVNPATGEQYSNKHKTRLVRELVDQKLLVEILGNPLTWTITGKVTRKMQLRLSNEYVNIAGIGLVASRFFDNRGRLTPPWQDHNDKHKGRDWYLEVLISLTDISVDSNLYKVVDEALNNYLSWIPDKELSVSLKRVSDNFIEFGEMLKSLAAVAAELNEGEQSLTPNERYGFNLQESNFQCPEGNDCSEGECTHGQYY